MAGAGARDLRDPFGGDRLGRPGGRANGMSARVFVEERGQRFAEGAPIGRGLIPRRDEAFLQRSEAGLDAKRRETRAMEHRPQQGVCERRFVKGAQMRVARTRHAQDGVA